MFPAYMLLYWAWLPEKDKKIYEQVREDIIKLLPNESKQLAEESNIMDDYSRFPEVEIFGSTSAKTVIPKLDSIFARQGIPVVVSE